MMSNATTTKQGEKSEAHEMHENLNTDDDAKAGDSMPASSVPEQHYDHERHAHAHKTGESLSTKTNLDDNFDEGDDDEFKKNDEELPVTFPQKLMEILSDENNESCVCWLPHGKGFTIRDKKQFADTVLPKYFKKSKFTSFTRKLNRWNFVRVTRGPETGAYYHPLFQKDNLRLCTQMTCISSKVPQQLQPMNPIALGLTTPLPTGGEGTYMNMMYPGMIPPAISPGMHGSADLVTPNQIQNQGQVMFQQGHPNAGLMGMVPPPSTSLPSSGPQGAESMVPGSAASQGVKDDGSASDATKSNTNMMWALQQQQQRYYAMLVAQQQMAMGGWTPQGQAPPFGMPPSPMPAGNGTAQMAGLGDDTKQLALPHVEAGAKQGKSDRNESGE